MFYCRMVLVTLDVVTIIIYQIPTVGKLYHAQAVIPVIPVIRTIAGKP